MWFSIAAANGNPRAQYNLRKITDRMREEEVVLGEKMANDWLKENPQKL